MGRDVNFNGNTMSLPKTTSLIAARASIKMIALPTSLPVQRMRGKAHQRSNVGVTIKAPTASPNHQVIQMGKKLAQGLPANDRQTTPTVALSKVLRIAARRVNLK